MMDRIYELKQKSEEDSKKINKLEEEAKKQNKKIDKMK
jgi:hypothetical protein